METNQKNEQKRSIMTTVFVAMGIVLLLCILAISLLGKEIYQLKKQWGTIRSDVTATDGRAEVVEEDNSAEVPEQSAPETVITEVPGEESVQEPEAKHKVYLTFDDGPSKQTEAVLDILDEYGVKATFFVVGKEGENVAKRLQMIYERGHTLGMHSYSHDYSDIYESVDAFRADFLKSKQYIYEATGVETKVFRFPGGSSNRLGKTDMNLIVEFLKEQGVEYYDWNISSGDGGGTLMPVEVIVENCTKNIQRYDTSIILMHDSALKTTTVEALPQILETILAMEDTVILPITANSQPVHHVIKPWEKPKEEVTVSKEEDMTVSQDTEDKEEKKEISK